MGKTKTAVQEYDDIKNREARDELIFLHFPTVRHAAQRIKSRIHFSIIDEEDLVQEGVIGLIDAIEKYDASRGSSLRTYLQTRVRGAMIDSLRRIDWAPRKLRRKQREVTRIREQLERSIRRPATESEMAEEMGISTDEYNHLMLSFHDSTMIHFENLLEENDDGDKELTLFECLCGTDETNPHRLYEKVEEREVLYEMIRYCLTRKQKVVILLFLEDLTNREIGEIVGADESAVSQLKNKVIKILCHVCKERFSADAKKLVCIA